MTKILWFNVRSCMQFLTFLCSQNETEDKSEKLPNLWLKIQKNLYSKCQNKLEIYCIYYMKQYTPMVNWYIIFELKIVKWKKHNGGLMKHLQSCISDTVKWITSACKLNFKGQSTSFTEKQLLFLMLQTQRSDLNLLHNLGILQL